MKAYRLTLAVTVAALFAGGQARAHFLPTFAPAPHGGSGHFGPPPGPDHGDAFRVHHRRGPFGYGDGGGLYVTPEVATPEEPALQAEPLPEPLFFPAPIAAARAVAGGPRIIIVDQTVRARPRGALPEVIYGAPLR